MLPGWVAAKSKVNCGGEEFSVLRKKARHVGNAALKSNGAAYKQSKKIDMRGACYPRVHWDVQRLQDALVSARRPCIIDLTSVV